MACLDTSFLIDLLKNHPNAILMKDKLEKNNIPISLPSPIIIELIRGFNSLHSNKHEQQIIMEFIRSTTTLPLDKTSAILAGEIENQLIKEGKTIDIEDIMIAAISITNNQSLITRNSKHFERIKTLKIESY